MHWLIYTLRVGKYVQRILAILRILRKVDKKIFSYSIFVGTLSME